MLSIYRKVTAAAARSAIRAWPAALSLVIYALVLMLAIQLAGALGFLGGILLGVVAAGCWSSYLELIAQAVAGQKIELHWGEFKRTFGSRFWDVISVMFAFFIISFLTGPLRTGPNGVAMSAILGIATAFFFNPIPELLYQGTSRSFALLMDSARFMLARPVVWLLPNLVFAALALAAGGGLRFHRPAELMIAFGNIFSSPTGVAGLFAAFPLWALPLAIFGLHYAMIFRGLLFRELSTPGAGGNARLRAFQNASRR
jgi:hypothetical protein